METDPTRREIYELNHELLDISRSMKSCGYVLEDLTFPEDDYNEEEIREACKIQAENAANYIKHFDELIRLKAQL